MLPTPGTKSVRLEMTMKMKNVVANGKTQRVTRLSRMSPIKLSQPSTSASSTFCMPDGISLMFFQVVTRTTIKMSAATIQVQIIELVTGKPKTLKTAGGGGGNHFFRRRQAGPAQPQLRRIGCPRRMRQAGWACRFTANIAAKNARTKTIFLKRFTK